MSTLSSQEKDDHIIIKVNGKARYQVSIITFDDGEELLSIKPVPEMQRYNFAQFENWNTGEDDGPVKLCMWVI